MPFPVQIILFCVAKTIFEIREIDGKCFGEEVFHPKVRKYENLFRFVTCPDGGLLQGQGARGIVHFSSAATLYDSFNQTELI